jgi:enoyl-CoA hydratase
VRCIILTGAGGHFSAGADLRAMAGDPDDDGLVDVAARSARDPDILMKGLLKAYRPSKPLIAAVEGVAVAGGAELLLATEIRVAGQSARFGVSEVRWSLYPMGGGVVRLARQIPYSLAADLVLTGRHIGAQEAWRLGLFSEIVPDGQALARAGEIAQLICENGPLSVREIVRTLRETVGLTESEAFAHEHARGTRVTQSEDALEGARAFSQKRKPNFRGR